MAQVIQSPFVLVAPMSSRSVALRSPNVVSFQVPPMEWAQRKDSIYLTIKIPDLTNERVGMAAPWRMPNCVFLYKSGVG